MTRIELPQFIKDSTILSGEEKLFLESIDQLPTEIEVDAIRYLPEINELLNAFIGDDTTRMTHLQLKAKEYIGKDNLMAWKILLL